jgi:hypothetical protein
VAEDVEADVLAADAEGGVVRLVYVRLDAEEPA